MDAMWREIVRDSTEAAADGRNYCCPYCLEWLMTDEDKQRHMEGRHHVKVLTIVPILETHG